MKPATLSVGQLNEYVRRVLATDPMLRYLCVVGEISNLKRHVSGHWYFSLKDDEAAVNCAMFRQSAFGLTFRPENGMRVRVFGNVSLYAKTGQYQFYVESMEQDGLGTLFMRFEALKQRLMEEGLFDSALKKPLPAYVRGVGIVTSKTGAVVHDIARVAWRRDPSVQLYLCPASVQGEKAVDEIVAALRLLDRYDPAEVIIVGRGGGSMEDLWPFNEEKVARAIAACRKPVISAVGHETDFTIADFVADLRAATPSAAAEQVVQHQEEIHAAMESYRSQMTRLLEGRIAGLEMDVLRAKQNLISVSPDEKAQRQLSRIAQLRLVMQSACAKALDRKAQRLSAAAPLLERYVAKGVEAYQNRLARAQLRLRTASPMDTLRRGYSVVFKDGKAVRNVDELKPGDLLSLRMSNGTVDAAVSSIRKEP